MGMGCAAAYDDVIEAKNVEEICPNTFKAFMDVAGKDFEQFAADATHDEISEYDAPLLAAYEALQKEFKKKTKLTLSLSQHNSNDNGDRYDEVDGAYWSVGGMYQLTPAGKKIGDIVQRKFFVTFG